MTDWCAGCVFNGLKRVPFEGPRDASFAIVGEAPGRTEVAGNRPFIGESGNVLNRLLQHLGIQRAAVLIGNALLCGPLSESDKQLPQFQQALKLCRERREAAGDLGGVRYVLAAGSSAAEGLLGERIVLGGKQPRRGGVHRDAKGRIVVPTWHPAALLRAGGDATKGGKKGGGLSDAEVETLAFDIERTWQLSTGQRRMFAPVVITTDSPVSFVRWIRTNVGPDRKLVSIDVETDSVDPTKAGLLTVGLAVGLPNGSVSVISFWWPAADAAVKGAFRALLARSDLEAAYHNCQFDISVDERHVGPSKNRVFDTMLAMHAAFPEVKLDLGSVAHTFLATAPWKFLFREWERRHKKDVEARSPEWIQRLQTYNALDAAATVALVEPLREECRKRKVEQIHDLDVRQALVARKMTERGLLLSPERRAEIQDGLEERERKSLAKLEAYVVDAANRALTAGIKIDLVEKLLLEIQKSSNKGLRKPRIKRIKIAVDRARRKPLTQEQVVQIAQLQATSMLAVDSLVGDSDNPFDADFLAQAARSGVLVDSVGPVTVPQSGPPSVDAAVSPPADPRQTTPMEVPPAEPGSVFPPTGPVAPRAVSLLWAHPSWPALGPYFGLEAGRVRVDLFAMPDDLRQEALSLELPCVSCGKPLRVIRPRSVKVDVSKVRHLYYTPACSTKACRCAEQVGAAIALVTRVVEQSPVPEPAAPPKEILVYPEPSPKAWANKAWNPHSANQLRAAFDLCGVDLPANALTKTGQRSLSKHVLVQVFDHPIVGATVEVRKYRRMLSVYFESPKLDIGEDNRLRVGWKVHGTPNGRWSSGGGGGGVGDIGIAVQNWPVSTIPLLNMRRMVVAPLGYKLVGADFAQLEFRMLALFAGEQSLLAIFNDPESKRDIHAENAARLYGSTWVACDPTLVVDPLHGGSLTLAQAKQVMKLREAEPALPAIAEQFGWSEQGLLAVLDRLEQRTLVRKFTKTGIYAAAYGAAPTTVQSNLRAQSLKEPDPKFARMLREVSLTQCKMFCDAIPRLWPAIERWRRERIMLTQRSGAWICPFSGRRRVWPMGRVDAAQALNTPIQMAAGSLMNDRFLALQPFLPSDVYIVLQVHDSLTLEVPEAKAVEIKKLLERVMTTTLRLGQHECLFTVEAAIGNSWGEA